MNINDTARRAYEAARERGHFQDETGITGYFARIHTDLGRALDAHRRNEPELRHPARTGARPTGPQTHLADAAIRVMTLSHHHGLDLEQAVRQSLAYRTNISPKELSDLDMSRAAWDRYTEQHGDPSAANFDEMMWGGHQTLASASHHVVRSILQLEANGVRTNEADQRTKNNITTHMAHMFIWLLGAGFQINANLPELIEAIIEADARKPRHPTTTEAKAEHNKAESWARRARPPAPPRTHIQ